MEKFLSVLLTAIIIIYVLRLLAKLLLPLLARKYMKRMSDQFGQAQDSFFGEAEENEQRQEGDVNVHSRPQKSQNAKKRSLEGEYVDFEEIE